MERNADHEDFWDIADEFIATGKVFSEWVAVSSDEHDGWPPLIDESIAFVDKH